MSSSPPPKPWERGDTGAAHLSSSLPQSTNSRDDSFRPILNRGTLPSARSSSAMTDTPLTGSPPQPPPRSQNSTPRYGGMGYGGMGYGGSGVGYGMGYGGYGGSYGGMYSPYGSGGMYGGYGRMGGGYNGEQSQFARVAEESSRPAFQSIENIVNAFGSVAMMLESTFYAVYNSFRAVIGVADHFTRMKAHFTQIFTTVAFIRPFLWLWRKLKHLLGYSQNVGSENAWSEVSKNGLPLSEDGKPKSSWPILLFFAVVFGGPWLIWKLLSSVQSNEASQEWATGEDDHFEAVAQYSFDGRSDDELSFRNGQRINIAPKELQPRTKGWLLASVDGKKGLIPVNYIKILGKRRGRKKGIQNCQQQPPRSNAFAVDEERLLDDEFAQSDLEQQPYATAFPTQPNEDEEKIGSDILADNDSELTGQIDSS